MTPEPKSTARSRPRRPDAGFTLPELLVALALLALTTALLAGALTGGRKAFESIEHRSAQASFNVVRTMLQDTIASAEPFKLMGLPSGDNRVIEASGDHLVIVTSYVPRGQYDGIYQTELKLLPSLSKAATLDLVMVQTLYRLSTAAPDAAQSGRDTRLVAGIASAAFKYYGRFEAEKSEGWVEAWRNPSVLPKIASIEITLSAGDLRTWPPLVIGLRLAD